MPSRRTGEADYTDSDRHTTIPQQKTKLANNAQANWTQRTCMRGGQASYGNKNVQEVYNNNVLLTTVILNNSLGLIFGVTGVFFVPTGILGLRRFDGWTNASVFTNESELSQDKFG